MSLVTGDVLAAGASVTPSLSTEPALQFRIAFTLGGVIAANSRDEASEIMHSALSALAQSLPDFVDLEAQTSVAVLPSA